MATLGYCTVGSNQMEDAKTFYDAFLGSAGITPLFEHTSRCGVHIDSIASRTWEHTEQPIAKSSYARPRHHAPP